MRRKVNDMLTGDMFGDLQGLPAPDGYLNIRQKISLAMGDIVNECKAHGIDRFKITAEMSRLLDREITVHMLNAYTSRSREEHFPPLDTAIAFDLATGGVTLLKLYADLCGCNISVGKEVLLTELGRIDQLESEIKKQKKAIEKQLEKM